MSTTPQPTMEKPQPQPTTADPDDFSRSLVEAMRRVVEASRDRTVAELRSVVEAETGQIDVTRAAREAALRERVDAEVAGAGAWERAEIERIRAEAVRKVQTRRGQLDQELAELATTMNAERTALAARADGYERQVVDFIASLDGIDDPAAFAAAARRMPTPSPIRDPQPPAATVEESSRGTETAKPEVDKQEAAGSDPLATAATTTPVGAAVPATGPAATPDARESATTHGDTSPEAATSIMVRGLSSFGAITSFKQALERADGIQSVTLGLGTSGEFVFSATHAAAFDMDAAIRAIEAGAEITRDGEAIRVKVTRSAA